MKSLTLSLFFSKGMSLKSWDKIGMFEREVALYKKLQDHKVQINFITYGDSSESDYSKVLPGINILSNNFNLPNYIYEKFLHRIHKKILMDSHIIKTNQMKGANIALRSSLCWNKPLIARFGYMWSEFAKQNGENSFKKIEVYENKVINSSKRVVVTTNKMKNNIINRIPKAANKTLVIPNYVEVDRFTPNFNRQKEFDLLYVGRLNKQKNIQSLISAVKSTQIKTMIIGNGPQKKLVQEAIGISNGKITWVEKISNSELPEIMNNSSIFILPSFYEGHPKTLIEAMACGMPVIGANSPGIREIIEDGKNGILCNTESESIQKSINSLLSNPELTQKIGNNAREFVLNNFSLDNIINMEVDLYRDLI
ncbi:MAG: hypothetical protein CMG75_07775 [Candidatus Marinimicrobia bacterium]|nr:hypothetical protein [Candidatus Neomarinimicrobiota bacterium]|tara:strand:- start:6970 stop:8070 length:1101 start_codon:yes stop_codon:yes gene_type:complete